MKRLFLILAVFFTIQNSYSQQSRILVQNEPAAQTPVINIKWYSSSFIYPRGVNIYRRNAGTSDWQKINNSPLVMMKEMPKELIAKDSSLLFFSEFIRELPADQMKGFHMINVFAKSFVSADFARFCGKQYDDKTVQSGTSYEYRIMQLTDNGEKEIGISPVIIAGAYSPIDPPADIVINAGDKKAEMNWKVEESRYYALNIYRRSTLNPVQEKITPNPVALSKYRDSLGILKYPDIKYTDDSLKEEVTYWYIIKAVDFFGNESAPSKEFEVLIRDITAPAPPYDLDRRIKNQKVMLNWRTKLTKDWVGVNVYRSDGVDSQYVRITKAPLAVMDTLYTDSVPAPGSYYYYVASVDKAGNEGHSFKTYADVADIFPPARVGGITIQSDTGKIIISWNASKEKDLAGYQLYRRSDSGNDESFALMNASPVIGTTYTDTLAKNIRSSICYKIVAVDTALNRGEYSDVACAKMPDIQPPVQPYIKKISNKNGLVMEWIPNKDEDLMGYDLYRCSLKDSTLVMDKANSSLIGKDKISFSDSLAKQGVKYYYFLIAYDSAKNASPKSELFSASFSNSANAQAKEFKMSVSVKKKYVSLKWANVKGNGTITYMVYRDDGSGSLLPVTGMLQAGKYKDIGNKKQCRYQVRAYSEEDGLIAVSETLEVK